MPSWGGWGPRRGLQAACMHSWCIRSPTQIAETVQHATMSGAEPPANEEEVFIGQAEGQLEGDVLADLEGQQNPDGEDMRPEREQRRRPCSLPALP